MNRTAKQPKPIHHDHPGHSAELPRVKRIRGQVEGLERMITQGRYCIDIITQIKAARSALGALENAILKSHLESCVAQALDSKSAFDASKKIKEITDLLGK